jgi:hypothetical protein
MKLKTENGYYYLIDKQNLHKIRSKALCYDKSIGYVLIKEGGKWILLHRYLMNAKSGQVVDHINRDKTDNRIKNLRFVNKSQNNFNRNVKKRDLPRGIYFDKYGNRYRACLSVNNKTLKLGSFKTIKEAKKVYDEKIIEIYGKDFVDTLHFELNI